jgi:hypothetical protein
MLLPIPGKSLPEMSRVGRAGMPLPNANTVVANTTEGEIIAERQANYVQSVGK